MAKCRICKSVIKPIEDDFIRLKNVVYYHTNCYKEREINNLVPEEVVDEVIKSAKNEYENDQEMKVKKYKNKSVQSGLDGLYDWIKKEYDISYFPKTFFIKMASVANGTHKGLVEPVAYTDVLDMLQRRKKQLDIRLASKKFSSNLNRFYYDLAVVLNQYDSYKAWKIVQENKKAEIIEDVNSRQRIKETHDLSKINKINKDENSIEDMIDDIFN